MSPRRAARVCSQPGCPNLVRTPGERFCPEHLAEERRRQDARRGSSAQRGYGPHWQKIRSRYLALHPRCEQCGAPATTVHHKVRLRDGGSNRVENLESLCQPCHSRLHAESGESFNSREDRAG